jgi:hypothetical protein
VSEQNGGKVCTLPGYGACVQYGEEVKVGLCSVTARVLRDESVDRSSLLEKKAVPSWDSFMGGDVRYFMEVPILKPVV